MPNYEFGKIYKITDIDTGEIYIGSTCQTLNQRLFAHNCKNNTMTQNLKNKKIELICNYSCNSREELSIKEQYYLDNNECINKNRAHGLTPRLEYQRKFQKKFRLQNKTRLNQTQNDKYRWKTSLGSLSDNSLWFIDTSLFLI
tara:strand:+ start:95 stop:523 length:429 start_codon:yes stop_codon:yes gene_type:complete